MRWQRYLGVLLAQSPRVPAINGRACEPVSLWPSAMIAGAMGVGPKHGPKMRASQRLLTRRTVGLQTSYTSLTLFTVLGHQ